MAVTASAQWSPRSQNARPPTDLNGSDQIRARLTTTCFLVMALLIGGAIVAFIPRPWQHYESNEVAGAPASAAALTSAEPTITFDRMREFVTEYYRELPANPMAAWSKLDAQGQQGTGQREFFDSWAATLSVTVLAVTPRDATSVVARLEYLHHDGQIDIEDRWMTVALVDSALLLHESGTLGLASIPPPLVSGQQSGHIMLTGAHRAT